MIVQTRHNRFYSYCPSSNRLKTKIDEDNDCAHVQYELSSTYDFSHIGMYTIEMTQQCNLRCRYCCYSGDYANRRQHNSSEISFDNLQKSIDFIDKHTPHDTPAIYVSFYGGEALLCRNKIEWFIRKLERSCPDKTFEFAISTNGLLINDEVVEWLSRVSNLFLTITVDGDRIMHDNNRVTISGNGSFDIIFRNLNNFRAQNPELYKNRVRFISTLKSISDLIRLNDFWMSNDLLRDNRPQHISSIIPNFDKGDQISHEENKFKLVYDECMNHYCNGLEDILSDELLNLVKPLKHRNYQELKDKRLISTCLNKPNSCFISSRGDIYVCERMCSQFSIGSLTSDIDLRLCKNINQQYLNRKNHYCSNCWAQRLCRRCVTGLNFNEEQFNQYCLNEKMQLKLAMQYYCEMLEFEHGINN